MTYSHAQEWLHLIAYNLNVYMRQQQTLILVNFDVRCEFFAVTITLIHKHNVFIWRKTSVSIKTKQKMYMYVMYRVTSNLSLTFLTRRRLHEWPYHIYLAMFACDSRWIYSENWMRNQQKRMEEWESEIKQRQRQQHQHQPFNINDIHEFDALFFISLTIVSLSYSCQKCNWLNSYSDYFWQNKGKN